MPINKNNFGKPEKAILSVTAPKKMTIKFCTSVLSAFLILSLMTSVASAVSFTLTVKAIDSDTGIIAWCCEKRNE